METLALYVGRSRNIATVPRKSPAVGFEISSEEREDKVKKQSKKFERESIL